MQKNVESTTNKTMPNDFLDNLGNHQHQKMLREIANDNATPKKKRTSIHNDLYTIDEEDDGLDYDTDSMTLNEF